MRRAEYHSPHPQEPLREPPRLPRLRAAVRSSLSQIPSPCPSDPSRCVLPRSRPANAASAQTDLEAGAMKAARWRMIGPFRGGRTKPGTGVPSRPGVFYIGATNGGVWKTTDYGRTWNRRCSTASQRNRSARLKSHSRIPTSSTSGLARACSVPISPPATASTSPPMVARPGCTSACAMDNRYRASSSIRATRTGSSSRCSAIRMARTPNGASSAR